MSTSELPREDLFRGCFPGDFELRDDNRADGAKQPVMRGHFAVFNEWTEINSHFEGRFLERIAPGAFKKTFAENGDKIRVLFQHGRDPEIGDKPLGAIRSLVEDDVGAAYEADLFDGIPPLVMAGLRANAYGASFRFKVLREEFNQQPERSDHNPEGLPERTLTEVAVPEFGPVTFGAYSSATASVRSLTDDFRGAPVERSPLTTDDIPQPTPPPEPEPDTEPEGDAVSGTTPQNRDETAPPHPEKPVRAVAPSPQPQPDRKERTMHVDEMRARRDEIKAELDAIAADNAGRRLDADNQVRWDELVAEREEIAADIKADEERSAYLATLDDKPGAAISGTGTYVTARRGAVQAPENVFDYSAYHGQARSQEHLAETFTDGAKRALETFRYPHTAVRRDTVAGHLERLIEGDDSHREIAQRFIAFGSPIYRSAFWKFITGGIMSPEEQRAFQNAQMIEARAMTTTDTGGVTVPVQIDPTIIPSSSGSINPFRRISKVVQTTSHQWQGVTSAGITAQYRAQGAVMTDNSPTLVAPTLTPERADAFVPFSWEAGQDWGSLETDLAHLMQDAKDNLEAQKFAVGGGTAEPVGVISGSGTLVGTSGATAFAVGDLYALENALPARFQPNASWVSNNSMYQKVRQFDTAGGANLWVQLQAENPPTLIGYPAYKASSVGTFAGTLGYGAKWGILGDFSYYAIVDRIGLQVRLIDNLFSGNTAGGIAYPTGQSGLVCYWRNTADTLSSNAFRVGTITAGA